MIAGGVAGQLCWIVSYPFDTVKTLIQTSDKDLSMRQVFVDGYKQQGLSYFFRGLGLTLARTFMVNSVILPMFDYITVNYVEPYAAGLDKD